MLSITNPPPPAVSTSLRAPQADLNARRIRRDIVLRAARRAFVAAMLVMGAIILYFVIHIGASIVLAKTEATVAQAKLMRAM